MENNKYLPIVLIAKREKDILSTEGGGNSESPKFVLDPLIQEDRQILEEKSLNFIGSIENIPELFVKKKSINNNTPVLIRVKVNEKSEAASHRQHIRKLIDKEENKIIGMSGNNNLLLRVDNEYQYNQLVDRLKNINDYCYGLSCIDEISINSPSIKISKLNNINLKIKLVNYNDMALNKILETFFTNYFKFNNIDYVKCHYTNALIIYKLLSINKTQLDNLVSDIEITNSIISIEPMPTLSITLDEVSHQKPIKVKKYSDIGNYPTIGILDNGIAPNNYLKDWIIDKRSPYLSDEIDATHGTFVAGIVNYGDELESESNTGCEPCKLFDAQVMPKRGIDEDELIDNIREIIKSHNDIKIWNMSLGTKVEADEYIFSDFAIALDEIQDKYNVLIVKSAGNCDYQNMQRISRSADSIRSLVVGSVAQCDGMSLKNHRSPFSRVGRGPSSIIKPDVVHYGGNLQVDGKPLGVNSFDVYGNIVQNCGTSFSTPRVSSLAANLQKQIGKEFDPLLIKALIIHNASYLNCILEQTDKIIETMGFGIPGSLNNMLKNDKDEITLIFRDKLQRGTFIDIFDLPIPIELIHNGNCTGQITATLVYNQILDAKQGNEYCQSNIDIKMGTYKNLKERDVESSNLLKNKYLPENPFNVLLKNNYSKKLINKNNSLSKKCESILVEYGKYHPVKKYCINLEELTGANKKKLCAGKKWYLQITGLYRNQIASEAKETGELLNQDFCLILTIKDTTKTMNIYDKTIKNVELGNFWHTPLVLSNEIRIDNQFEIED